jgi:hypothetical protein
MERSLGLVLVISLVAVPYDKYTLAALGLFGIHYSYISAEYA